MITILLTIAMLQWVVLVTPGANVLLVAQLAAAGRRKSACYAALGIATVALMWATIAILGVSAVLTAHPYLRLLLQAIGGFYLCYVAMRLWLSGVSAPSARPKALTTVAAFRLGFLTNIMNPKSALFFGGVFGTALPLAPSPLLLISAIALVFCNALAWHMMLAICFSHPSVQSSYENQRKRLSHFAGLILGALGLRLLVSALLEARCR